ncbi:MAG: SDR family oxidoreductase [Gammaproteobacteria bacterium]|nr:SDR family oxidoreductase [Gammaproteobacteria bacterium]MCY4358991.1 SDR family oxidoreductase [Gammaproteobacteria bacterium]
MSFVPDLLKGKRAIVTGGATGIGSHIVRKLGQLGANVGIISRRQESLQTAVKSFAADDNLEVHYQVGDVRKETVIQAAVASLADKMGGLDIMVCNAAGNFICPTENLSANGWRTVIDIDLNGTFHSCKAALPYLKEATDGGRIISISTSQANTGWPTAAHAGAAKAGIQNLMQSLAVEWGPYGIRANWITPGPIEGTEGVERLITAQGRTDEVLEKIPLGHFGNGEDIANAVVYLASTTGRYVSGTELAVDGAARWGRI